MYFPEEHQRLENEITAVGSMQPEDVRRTDELEWIEEEVSDADSCGDITEDQAHQLRKRIYSLMRS
jgi:hypothetical protein